MDRLCSLILWLVIDVIITGIKLAVKLCVFLIKCVIRLIRFLFRKHREKKEEEKALVQIQEDIASGKIRRRTVEEFMAMSREKADAAAESLENAADNLEEVSQVIDVTEYKEEGVLG